MNDVAIRDRLKELEEALAGSTVPEPGHAGVYLPENSRSEPSVDDVFDHIRLQIRYLAFDLEATRRENRYLRQMLEHRPNGEIDTDDGRPML